MTDPDAFDPTAPTHELIAFALSHPDNEQWENPHWDAIRALRERCTREVFDATAALLASACPLERALGANVHAQLGAPEGPFAVESADLLIRLIDSERDPGVLQAAIVGLGHLRFAEHATPLLPFVSHPHPDVRFAVAFALPRCDDPDATAALIALTADSETEVRNWATFGLGSLSECDAPEVRAALWARLNDNDGETRGEALRGLARRKAAGVAEAIEAELRGPDPHGYAIEAAEELASARLVPALEALRDGPHGGEWLDGVIAACRAGTE